MTETLPGAESFEALVQLLGQGDALVLCREYGGQRLYVPQKMNAANDIVRRVGQKAANTLAAEFGGTSIEIPRGTAITARKRRQIIMRKLFTSSANEIAREADCTARWVKEIRAKVREEDNSRQGTLFGEAD